MPTLTCYSSEPDGEFLRRLEADVELSDRFGDVCVEKELWQEVLNRFETLGTRPTEDEYKELERENEKLKEKISELEGEVRDYELNS